MLSFSYCYHSVNVINFLELKNFWPSAIVIFWLMLSVSLSNKEILLSCITVSAKYSLSFVEIKETQNIFKPDLKLYFFFLQNGTLKVTLLKFNK